MMQHVVRTITTVLLIALVGLSIALSIALWSGNLKEGSEIGFVQTPAMPIATTPDMSHVVRPYQMTVDTKLGYSLLPVDSTAYMFWKDQLEHVHAYDATAIQTLPDQTDMRVTIDFGVPLSRELGGNWLASFGTLLGAWEGRKIVIYKVAKQNMCHIAFVGSNSILTMRTDLNARSLLNHANMDVETNQAAQWGAATGPSYIPVDTQMDEIVYSVRQPDQIPLVHTFFVNPQAITRIEQDSNTVLWTDGSRAVQWDKANRVLRYQDPNEEQSTLRHDDLRTALNFIHTHGGGAQNVIGFDELSALTNQSSVPTYIFTQYVDGYPILSGAADYNLSMDSGHIVEYTRPTWVLQHVVKRQSVTVLDKPQLEAVFRRIDSVKTSADLQITLGYAITKPPASINLTSAEIYLQPVYDVANSIGSVWMINAVTGVLISGGDGS